DKTSSHANPDIKPWLEQPFYFYDSSQNWTAIRISQLIDHNTSLGYGYQPPTTATEAERLLPAQKTSAARFAKPEPLSPPLLEIQQSEGSKSLSPEPTTVRVEVPEQARDRMA